MCTMVMNIKAIKVIAIVTIIVCSIALLHVVTIHNNNVLDIVVIAGQSNAEYSEENENDRCNRNILNMEYATGSPRKNLYYYGTEYAPTSFWDESTWESSSIRSMWAGDKWAIGGYEPIVANELSKITNHDVLIINTGIAGMTVYQLSPGQVYGDYGFNIIEKAIESIKDDYDTINTLCYVWIQGESDWWQSVDYYFDNFRNVDDKMQSLGFDRCIFVHTRDKFGGNSNIAQESLCSNSRFKTVAYFTEDFTLDGGEVLEEEDTIHYSQKGRDVIAFSIVEGIKPWTKPWWQPL